METKEVKIDIPKGYEIDKKNSTFECIKFKPVKNITYEDCCKKLFPNYKGFYINAWGEVGNIANNFSLEPSTSINTAPNKSPPLNTKNNGYHIPKPILCPITRVIINAVDI